MEFARHIDRVIVHVVREQVDDRVHVPRHVALRSPQDEAIQDEASELHAAAVGIDPGLGVARVREQPTFADCVEGVVVAPVLHGLDDEFPAHVLTVLRDQREDRRRVVPRVIQTRGKEIGHQEVEIRSDCLVATPQET